MKFKVGSESVEVSPEDYDFLLECSWHLKWFRKGSPYAARTDYVLGKAKTLLMHRVIAARALGCIPVGMLIDHKNCNTLDNRRENLRIATRSQNNRNGVGKKGRKVKYKGVYKMKGCIYNPYMAAIRHEGKNKYLGCHATEEAAARAYDAAAKELCGEFARLNFPENV